MTTDCLEIRREAGGALFDVPHPPELLWVRARDRATADGLLATLPERGLAIVGARDALPRNRSEIERVCGKLPASLTVVSGLALGIDAAAHEAALARGMPTIAVLAHGIDQVYPRGHERLAERIVAAGGLIATEFAPGTLPRKHFFLQRNRLIAGWARATWVVQARARSGALNTAAWARAQGRAVFSTPCAPTDSEMAGNRELLDRDCAIALWDAHSLGCEWLELASLAKARDRPARPRAETPFGERVLRHLAREGELSIESALAWALRGGLSTAEFFDEVEAMRSRRSIVVGPDLIRRI